MGMAGGNPRDKRVRLIQQETGRKAEAELSGQPHGSMGCGIRIGEARCDVLGIAVAAERLGIRNYWATSLRQTSSELFQVLETVLN